MLRSVVLLDAETGGFAITDTGIKAIPKPTDGLHRHLVAVSSLAQALDAGVELDSDRNELEALTAQVANLAVRRLEASAGLVVLPAGGAVNGLINDAPRDPNAEPHEQQPDQADAGH